jgi:diacylglycerol kinase (ATP)
MEQANLVANAVNVPVLFRKIRVIINPSAGMDNPILHILNKVFGSTSTQWDVSITHEPGDAERLAKEAISSGCDLVAAHGGDGTVMEVSRALQNTGIPLAIFPGGTGNVMAGEMGISTDLLTSINYIAAGEYELRTVDMGMVNDKVFILRVSIGLEADMAKNTDQELKNRFGNWAYAFSAIKEIQNLEKIRFNVSIDGKVFDVEGISCMIANSSDISIGGLRLSYKVNVSDGLLDLLILDNVNLGTVLSVSSTVLTGGDSTENSSIHHWQGREIIVNTETPQTVAVDGEFITNLPVKVHVLPAALKIVIPKKSKQDTSIEH